MNPERYEKVGQLFYAALEVPPDRREAFLVQACGADEDLRQEVASLISAHEHRIDRRKLRRAIASGSLRQKPFQCFGIGWVSIRKQQHACQRPAIVAT